MAGQTEGPHILSNIAEQYIASRTSHSIFLVRALPRNDVTQSEAARQALTRLLEHYGTQRKQKGKSKKPAWSSGTIVTATGFAFEKSGNRLKILTAAHIIKEVYSNKPMVTNECEELNLAFHFEVQCIHQERDLLHRATPDQIIGDMNRWYTPATIVAIDSPLDLLALEFMVDAINVYDYDNGVLVVCPHDHGVIPITMVPPPDSERVLVQGWPDLRSDSTSWSNASFPERRYDTLTSTNPYKYAMKLIELPGVISPEGCSGGPVVNGRLCAVGVYHGVLEGYGYGVCVRDIWNFLHRFHLLDDPHVAPMEADEDDEDDEEDEEDEEDEDDEDDEDH